MNEVQELRAAVIGLIAFAGMEEQTLLRRPGASGAKLGSAHLWAACPIVAHDTEFKAQQVQRLEAVRNHEVPPEFPDTDHRSEDVYRRYAELAAHEVAKTSRDTTRALIDEVTAACDEDLTDPSRNPSLAGRQLWLQVAVRGFWHPMGHLGEYHLSREQPSRALELHERAAVLADLLAAPEPIRGLAFYNLACAQARSGTPDGAVQTLAEAIRLNPQLVTNASRDTDLEALRQEGRLGALVGSG